MDETLNEVIFVKFVEVKFSYFSPEIAVGVYFYVQYGAKTTLALLSSNVEAS